MCTVSVYLYIYILHVLHLISITMYCTYVCIRIVNIMLYINMYIELYRHVCSYKMKKFKNYTWHSS